MVNPFASAIRVYQRYVWLPGTVYGLLLLAGLGAIVAGRRRVSVDALLPWVSSVALIVVPAATAEFDYRYVTTAVPFACLALAIAFGRRPGALLRSPRRTREPPPKPLGRGVSERRPPLSS